MSYKEPKKYIRSYGDGKNISPAWLAWAEKEQEFEDAERMTRITTRASIDEAQTILNTIFNNRDDYDDGYNEGYRDGVKDGCKNAIRALSERQNEKDKSIMAHLNDNKYQNVYDNAFDGKIELENNPYMWVPENHSKKENKEHFQIYGPLARYDAADYPETKEYKNIINNTQKQYDFIKAHLKSVDDFKIAMDIIKYIEK